MTQIYTPTATSHGSYTLPSDGDPAVAESVNDALRDLADNTLVALNNAASALALAGQAVNGTTGGVYSPAAAIELATGGLRIDGGFGTDLVILTQSRLLLGESGSGITMTASGSMQVNGPAVFTGSSFTVTSDTATFSGAATTIENLTTGTSLQCNGDVTLGNTAADDVVVTGTLIVENDATFENAATFEGAVTIDTLLAGNSQFNGSVGLGNSSADNIVLNAILQFGGAGRVPYRFMTLPDASATIGITDGNAFRIPDAITGNWNYVLSSTSAEEGDTMLFFSGGNNVLTGNVLLSAVGDDVIMPSGGSSQFALFIFGNSQWNLAITSRNI